jgi:hypothetical protein
MVSVRAVAPAHRSRAQEDAAEGRTVSVPVVQAISEVLVTTDSNAADRASAVPGASADDVSVPDSSAVRVLVEVSDEDLATFREWTDSFSDEGDYDGMLARSLAMTARRIRQGKAVPDVSVPDSSAVGPSAERLTDVAGFDPQPRPAASADSSTADSSETPSGGDA